MTWVLFALAAAAGAYQILAVLAIARHLRKRDPEPVEFPPVSILKPVHGLDPHFYEGIRSHAVLDYPDYELLFGVSDPSDPAIPEIDRLASEFPRIRVRLIVAARRGPNQKVTVLADLAAAARRPVLVVNDSDIRVEPDYLRRIVAPLADPAVGVVTCLYRGSGAGLPGRFESVAIATDFIPSVLVAPLAGVSEFALGATLALRAKDLAAIGGFDAIAPYIADDYQLGRRVRRLGRGMRMSRAVVETSIGETTWAGVWRHQLRWARTIRVSRGGGYLGLPLTNATFWALLLALAGAWPAAVSLFGLRMAVALLSARAVLGDRRAAADSWLVPFRDLAGLAVWVAGLFGETVEWRGARMRLSPDGRITVLSEAPATGAATASLPRSARPE